MSTRRRGEFTLQLDKPRTWRLRWKDAKAIEDALSQTNGKAPVNWMAFRSKMSDWTLDDYAIVIWAGVRHDWPGVTVEQVMEEADWTVTDEFAVSFAKSLEDTMPDDVKKKVAAKQAEKQKQSTSLKE